MWLIKVVQALWMETVYNRARFLWRTLILGAASLLFVGFFVVLVALLSRSNSTMSGANNMLNERTLKTLGHTVDVPNAVPPSRYSLPPEITNQVLQLTRTLAGQRQEDSAATADNGTQNEFERLEVLAHRNLKRLDATKPITVYTRDRTQWPSDVLEAVERIFGPVKNVDEGYYLKHLQNTHTVWINSKMDNSKRVWWAWERDTYFGGRTSAKQIDVLIDFLNATGSIEQDKYIDNIVQSEEYQRLEHWDKVSMLRVYSPIDVRALALFLVLAVFIFPSLLAASQAITWDFNRNKNVHEPYANMRIPVWGVLLKESLSQYWYMVFWATVTAVVCGLLVSTELRYLLFLFGMLALGVSGCWLNLQINMFLVVTFQTPIGRQLARLLVMPFFYLPYHLFRVFGASEIFKILGGKNLESFSPWMFWGTAAACCLGGVAILWLSAWRVGQYRKGFAPT